MNALEILPLLASAVEVLFDRDRILFDLGTRGISEQTLTFRLGYYLQERFPNHHVDCEYNRLGTGMKTDEMVDQQWMKPDVIIHQRTRKMENLAVVEAKKALKWARGWTEIEQKLSAFTRRPGNYEYRLGMAWKIAVSQDPAKHDAAWFLDGTELCRTSLSFFTDDVSSAIEARLGAAIHEA